MKTNVLIGSAALWKDCLFLATGFGKKETEGMIFSEDVGKQGEWILFDKAATVIEALSEKVLPLNPNNVVKLFLNGIFWGEVVPFYNPDKGIIEIISVKNVVFEIEELRVAV